MLGLVDEINGEFALVSVKRANACGENCAMCKGGCTPTAKLVRAQNLVNARVGDNVIIEIADRNVLYGAFLVYVAPIFLMLLVFAVTQAFLESELYALLAGAVSFVFSLLLLKKTDDFLMKSGKYKIYITKNLNFDRGNDRI